MAKKYKVLVYPSAQKDLNEIKNYFSNILKTSSNSVFKKFLEQVQILKEHPLVYPVHQDSLLKLIGYRVIPIDNYLMFYVVKGDSVQIHRVLYAKRNYLQLLGIVDS
ncbi:type II toxin-antitoxin system RelE/ParE family toxin [Fibrobacter sp.]|uniref:type II toxin-antitoxin system RelE/ParE family toxin n=1 Tax=Fibrobacter sp. TaxID=35828 RepID=UPI00386F35E6